MAEVNSHADRGSSVLVTSAVFVALAFLAFICRFLTRYLIVRNAGRDDICIAIGWFFSLCLTVTIVFQVKYGLGKHQSELSEDEVTSMLKAFWVSLWTYYLSICFTKVGLILQYLRIFTQKWFRITAWALLAFIVAYSVWTVFSSVFACLPVAAFWDQSIHGKCLPHSVSWFVNAGINIATDLATVILPMPVVNKLQLPRKQRYALLLVFALGGFVCVVSMIRIRALVDISRSTDVSWSNPPAAAWSAIEANVGIICASLPSLKAAITRFCPRLFSSRSANGSRDYFSGRANNSRRLPLESGPVGTTHSRHGSTPHLSRKGMPGFGSHAMATRTDSIGETEMGNLGGSANNEKDASRNKINVVTIVEQEIEQRHAVSSAEQGGSTNPTQYSSPITPGPGDSDSDSEKGLFGSPFDNGTRYIDDFERYCSRK